MFEFCEHRCPPLDIQTVINTFHQVFHNTIRPFYAAFHSFTQEFHRSFHSFFTVYSPLSWKICIHLFCNRCDLQQLYLKSSRPYTDFPYFFLFFLTCSSRYGKIIFVEVAECKIWTRVSFPILLWINGKMNMRWCWNRQTGTFEGRVRERVGSSPIHRTNFVEKSRLL